MVAGPDAASWLLVVCLLLWVGVVGVFARILLSWFPFDPTG